MHLSLSSEAGTLSGMRTYAQFCAIAKGLDVIGDRWTLLIVRELLLRDSARYGELQRGLPGIATNLLAERLRAMEAADIVTRDGGRVRLTERGRALEPVVAAIARWGAPLLATSSPDDAFQGHWLVLPLRAHLRDGTPSRPPATLEVRTGDETVVVEARAGRVRVWLGSVPVSDAVLHGKPRLVLGVLLGKLDVATRGVGYEGDPAVLARVVPREIPRV